MTENYIIGNYAKEFWTPIQFLILLIILEHALIVIKMILERFHGDISNEMRNDR